MIVYHYTHLKNLRDILETGLQPMTLIAEGQYKQLAPESLKKRAIFGLLLPQDPKWKFNQVFPDNWQYLTHDIGPILLEIKVDKNDPDILIGDEAYFQAQTYIKDPGYHNFPPNIKSKDWAEVFQKYDESVVSIKEYLHLPDRSNYILPKVLITKTIPSEYLEISKNQELLQEYMKSLNPETNIYKNLVRELREFDDLEGFTGFETQERRNLN